MGTYVLGITGASGIILGIRTLQALNADGHFVHCIMSKDASLTAVLEMGSDFASAKKIKEMVSDPTLVAIHKNNDFSAPIASGGLRIDGTAIVPCSMSTLGGCAAGISDNLIRRSADVALKEGFPLILVPRETPFSTIQLENMLRLSRAGAKILPPIPAWYVNPTTVEEIENFIVGKVLDALGVPNSLFSRWTGQPPEPAALAGASASAQCTSLGDASSSPLQASESDG